VDLESASYRGQAIGGRLVVASSPVEMHLQWSFCEIHSDPKDRDMGIQHAPKSQRNASKKRRKARKHKNRSTKKYKLK
jgi:hypothetical protein